MKIKNTVNLLSKSKQSHNYILLINYLSFKLFIIAFSLILLFSVSYGYKPTENTPTSRKEEIFNLVPTHKGSATSLNDPAYADYLNGKDISLNLVKDESDFDGVYGKHKTKDEFLNDLASASDNTFHLKIIDGSKVTLTLPEDVENPTLYLKDAQLYKYNNSLYNASYELQENTSGLIAKMKIYIESDLTYLKLIVGMLGEGYDSIDGYFNFGAKLVYSNVINTTP